MKKIAAPLLFCLLFVVFGVHAPVARAQIKPEIDLTIGTQVDFDPANLFDPSTLTPIGTVSAKDNTERWRFLPSPNPITMFAVYESNEEVKLVGNSDTLYEIDDIPAPGGCSAPYLPTPRSGSETWAIYNAVKGEAPKLVGVRYVAPRGEELWFVGEEFKYGGEKDSYLIAAKDGTVERDDAWTHTFRVMR